MLVVVRKHYKITFSSSLGCLNASLRVSRNELSTAALSSAFSLIVVAPGVVAMVVDAVLFRTFCRCHVWWKVTIAATLIFIQSGAAHSSWFIEGTEVDGKGDDGDDDSNSWDNDWRSCQLARMFQITWHRLAIGRPCVQYIGWQWQWRHKYGYGHNMISMLYEVVYTVHS